VFDVAPDSTEFGRRRALSWNSTPTGLRFARVMHPTHRLNPLFVPTVCRSLLQRTRSM
jgi:hypothetical protein